MTDSELLQGIYTTCQEISFWLQFGVGVFVAYVALSLVFRWLR